MKAEDDDWQVRLERKVGNLDILPNIAEELGIEPKRLYRWSENGRKNGFPKVVRTQGKYNLYNKDEVAEWVFLWLRISKNLGNKNLNGRNGNG